MSVLPASAGMILELILTYSNPVCAPRIRGDDPRDGSPRIWKTECSPRPWG